MPSHKKIEAILGVRFSDPKLLTEALTHRSYLNEAKDHVTSNERLEFLGDAILSFVISKHLFSSFPDLPEGKLTNLRSAIVKTPTLAEAAQRLTLGEFLLLSKGEEESGGRQNASLLADVFESVVGAIFIDQGLTAAQDFLNRQLILKIPDIIHSRAITDFKSDLQEKVQAKYRISPIYKVVQEKGPDHAKVFTVAVFVLGREEGLGAGRSKQEAEQEAARVALEKWLES